MRQLAVFALAFVGISIAVLAGTGTSAGTADVARREACQRAISYGVLPIGHSEQRVSVCTAAAAHRASGQALAQVASGELVAGR